MAVTGLRGQGLGSISPSSSWWVNFNCALFSSNSCDFIQNVVKYQSCSSPLLNKATFWVYPFSQTIQKKNICKSIALGYFKAPQLSSSPPGQCQTVPVQCRPGLDPLLSAPWQGPCWQMAWPLYSKSAPEITTCDVETSTTHFSVPFGPIYIYLKK